MKKNIILVVLVLVFGLVFGQKNKYEDILNSRKLGYAYRTVKDKDKEDYYQQYYWLLKSEELRLYPHLQDIKPKILYEFIREINPQNNTKNLSEEDKAKRNLVLSSLNQYFSKREFDNEVMKDNLETFVDPSGKKYFSKVNPERVAAMLPKRLYTLTSNNTKSNMQKTYYLYVDREKEKYQLVEMVPSKEDTKFYASLDSTIPDYEFPNFVPSVETGKRNDKDDKDFIYITPFEIDNTNIIYKTDDFKTFELVKFKKDGGPWTEVDTKKKKKSK